MALAAGAGRMGGQKPLPPAPCLGLPFAPSSSPVLPLSQTLQFGSLGSLSLEAGRAGMWAPVLWLLVVLARCFLP